MTFLLAATVLATTNVWNPIPQLVAWWDRLNAISEPSPPWSARLGGVPDIAAVMSTGQVVAATRGLVDAYDAASGRPLWHYDAYWALPAGDVVVIRQQAEHPDQTGSSDRGYSVIDANTGAVLWGERDAGAVWAFADRILDLTCPGTGDCQLRAYAHRDRGTPLWSVAVPGEAHAIRGADPALLGTRSPAHWFDKAAAGTPGLLPGVIGLNVDGRIQIVDTRAGIRVREVSAPDPQTRVFLSGDRILYSRVERGGASCHFSLQAVDYRSNAPAWSALGYDLGSASGAGCEQRDDPLGAGGYLVGLRTDNDPVLIDAADGTVAWTGVPSEKVLATDGELAAILGADRRTVKIIDLLGPDAPVVWSGTMSLEPQAAITRHQVVIRDGDASRLVIVNHLLTGSPEVVKTTSVVVGYGPSGLVLASGRRFGVIPVRD